jgi:hypothetical protein
MFKLLFLLILQGTSINIVTRLWDGWPGFNSWQVVGLFLLTTVSRLALEPTQPPIQCELGVPSLGVKQLGHEADHSPPFSANVKNVWYYTSTPPIHLHGMVLMLIIRTTSPSPLPLVIDSWITSQCLFNCNSYIALNYMMTVNDELERMWKEAVVMYSK